MKSILDLPINSFKQIEWEKCNEETTYIEPEYDSVYIRSLSVLDHEKI
jgi:hypothetical protein